MAQGAFWNNWKNQAIPASGSTISTNTASGAYSGWQGGATSNVAVDPYVSDLLSMSKNDIFNVSQLLKSAGYLRNTTSKYNKAIGDAYTRAAMDWATESARTGRPDLTLKGFLQENMMPTTGGAKPKADLTRSIYQYSPEQLGAKIDEVAQSLLGRTITDADKQADWYSDLNNALNKMVQKGTVSTTKQVRNPKTGKLELVSIQKPEVTTEAITQKITGALESADPESLERKKRIDFTSWLFGQMGGRG